MSKLIYLMPLWSGCEDYLVRALQFVQNKAARSVAKLNIFTPTKTLMKLCGWMSVRQLLAYHSLVLFHKTLAKQSPVYLYHQYTSHILQVLVLRSVIHHPVGQSGWGLGPERVFPSRAGVLGLLSCTILYLLTSDCSSSNKQILKF